ncbi:tetraacyldisaccharide 4'-kinase [Caldimonas sp.]|uniref:tetraacyldisaccharide 4'-kinase n=1 Tax=Caldimonas sp. TaxID=2838790 RepID=UPI00307DBFB0
MPVSVRVAMRLQAAWSRRGPLACALWPLSWLYRALATWHGRAYAWGLRPRERLPCPVVVVGNVVAGGAGKTPTVIATVRALRAAGERPGIVSRGYGRSSRGLCEVTSHSPATEVGDEPLLMHLRTGAPVAVGHHRAAAGRFLLARHPELTVIVCDDGLQHPRLARDVEVLVFDERGIGNGWWLPAGPLRDHADRRADLVLYNAPAASTARAGWLARRALGPAIPLAQWWQGAHTGRPLSTLADTRVLAVAGIAHPQRYFDMLRAAGLHLDTLALADHHVYTEAPWRGHPADVVLLTEKDAVKLPPGSALASDPRLHVVALDFEPDPHYHLALQHLLQGVRAAQAAQEEH